MKRREILGLGLAGGALSLFGRACEPGSKAPEPPPPADGDPVYALMPGDSLYDDFDGHGCYQSYDDRDQAQAGALGDRIWIQDGGAQVVDGGSRGFVLEIGCVGQMMSYAWLKSPREIEFAQFGSLRADVLLSSRSTAPRPLAGLNFHTTIPEQPPGRSWFVTLGLFKDPSGPGALVIGQYGNLNLGILENDTLGAAALDEWHSLRLDILTRAEDPALGPADLRLDYYLDGSRLASRIPEDSAILIDPDRTGLGPHRSLIVSREGYVGEAYGSFDHVRARYDNRTA
jgi:hypothetical protein